MLHRQRHNWNATSAASMMPAPSSWIGVITSPSKSALRTVANSGSRFMISAVRNAPTRTVDTKSKVATNDNLGGLALSTSYQYDGEGRVIAVTEPGNKVTKTSYDKEGRVVQVTVDPKTISSPNDNPNGLNLITTYAYDTPTRTVTVTEGAGSALPHA